MRSAALAARAVTAALIGVAACVPIALSPRRSGTPVLKALPVDKPLTTSAFVPPPGRARFVDPGAIVLDSMAAKDLRPSDDIRGPNVPKSAAGHSDANMFAFVVDSAGRIELPTITFLNRTSTVEMEHALCAMLLDFKFERVPGQFARTLVVISWRFNGASNVKTPSPKVPKEFERYRASSPDSLFRWMESRDHCR